MFMTMLLNATIVLRIDPLWQYTVLGLVVFVAVAADALTSARKP
jgi:hypothetical protein